MIKKLTRHIYQNPFFIKLFNWEYWPFHIVYLPIYPVFIWLGIKARSIFFFSASNPTIKNGGFLMEQKHEIDKLLPEAYKPITLFFEFGTTKDIIKNEINKAGLNYPLIFKPDVGAKGSGVIKVNNDNEFDAAMLTFKEPFIVQPYINLANEIGLFYVRLPNEATGKITGIVSKQFLKITGDGHHTLLQLLQNNPRHILQIPALKKVLQNDLQKVIPAGISEIIVPYGNHARGCLFLDHSHLICAKLEQTFAAICNTIPGFYYGRMDIRYNTWEEMLEGKNISIIELNGAGSEPTHIYDPKHSIFFGWKEIIRHLNLLFKVSKLNKELNGVDYMSFADGLEMFKQERLRTK